jgi:hypothetical protein
MYPTCKCPWLYMLMAMYLLCPMGSEQSLVLPYGPVHRTGHELWVSDCRNIDHSAEKHEVHWKNCCILHKGPWGVHVQPALPSMPKTFISFKKYWFYPVGHCPEWDSISNSSVRPKPLQNGFRVLNRGPAWVFFCKRGIKKIAWDCPFTLGAVCSTRTFS